MTILMTFAHCDFYIGKLDVIMPIAVLLNAVMLNVFSVYFKSD